MWVLCANISCLTILLLFFNHAVLFLVNGKIIEKIFYMQMTRLIKYWNTKRENIIENKSISVSKIRIKLTRFCKNVCMFITLFSPVTIQKKKQGYHFIVNHLFLSGILISLFPALPTVHKYIARFYCEDLIFFLLLSARTIFMLLKQEKMFKRNVKDLRSIFLNFGTLVIANFLIRR